MPFRPHVVARRRQSAYMFKAVMAYLDNLFAWGDFLFRQDSPEAIDEAMQIYVLAANILGRRPQPVPKKGSVRPQTYANLRGELNKFANALVDLETDILFDIAPHPAGTAGSDGHFAIRSMSRALYFCVPPNDKLLGYWTTVADRLFKIRNSLNIMGVFRQLPLWEPAIDPALLARGAAAGLDIGAIVSGANQPLPLVRFQFLVQKAAEICQEVKSFGAELLSAIEKEDNETLAIMRARHERVILEKTEMVRYAQYQEAIKAREGLEKSLVNVEARYQYYEKLLGSKESDIKIPADLEKPDATGLEKLKLKVVEPVVQPRAIEVDIVQDPQQAAGGKKISSYELQELERLEEARGLHAASAQLDLVGSYLSLIPQFGVAGEPLGVGGNAGFGGVQLSKMASMMAGAIRLGGDEASYQANKAAKIGSYGRREQEWAFQSNLAAGEITQTLKQLRAAQIREAIAEREWKNHQQQISNSKEVEQFLAGEKKGKKSNQALYAWMKRETKGLYAQSFQFAFDVAKKAERALQHELGDPTLSFVQFGYLAGKEGLLAGEKLHLDVKRMELAYHELNQREYELTKHVSLLQVDPRALLELRATGKCTISLAEELFDLDCPGHFFRRIKSVAVSIPCVVGPYSGLSCTLTLQKSTIRKSAGVGTDYVRESEDERFSDYFGTVQSIVTSTGQNDGGLFETNLRDERYLPFEGYGAVSEWQLQLPADPRNKDPQQFDYNTIADVILHVRYTAREGGKALRDGALTNLKTRIEEASAAGSVRLLSVKHEFPSEWAKFTGIKIDGGAVKTAELAVELRDEHYPFWSRTAAVAIKRVDVIARAVTKPVEVSDKNGKKDPLGVPLGDLRIGKLAKIPLPAATGKWSLLFNDNGMKDLWIALTWGR